QYHELIGAQSRDCVPFASVFQQTVGGRLKEVIAGSMAACIVDTLEAIQVDLEQGTEVSLVCHDYLQDLLKPAGQYLAVWQAGKVVMLLEIVRTSEQFALMLSECHHSEQANEHQSGQHRGRPVSVPGRCRLTVACFPACQNAVVNRRLIGAPA